MLGMLSKGMGSYLYGAGTKKKDEVSISQQTDIASQQSKEPTVQPLTAENLSKLQQH